SLEAKLSPISSRVAKNKKLSQGASTSEFLDHLKKHGIIVQRTPSYTSPPNGVIMPLILMYAFSTWFQLKRLKRLGFAPYEVWHGQVPKLSYLKDWGCAALVKRDTLTKPDKLEPKSIKCIFIRYPKETMGYFFYYPPENKIFVTRNAEFLENSRVTQEASGSLEDHEIIQEDTHPSVITSLDHDKDDQEIDKAQSDINPNRRSTRTQRTPDHICLYIDAEEHDLRDHNEPANYKAALLDLESKK
nr:hypothetical protein [Tanacetum cinerariifolium]